MKKFLIGLSLILTSFSIHGETYEHKYYEGEELIVKKCSDESKRKCAIVFKEPPDATDLPARGVINVVVIYLEGDSVIVRKCKRNGKNCVVVFEDWLEEGQ